MKKENVVRFGYDDWIVDSKENKEVQFEYNNTINAIDKERGYELCKFL